MMKQTKQFLPLNGHGFFSSPTEQPKSSRASLATSGRLIRPCPEGAFTSCLKHDRISLKDSPLTCDSKYPQLCLCSYDRDTERQLKDLLHSLGLRQQDYAGTYEDTFLSPFCAPDERSSSKGYLTASPLKSPLWGTNRPLYSDPVSLLYTEQPKTDILHLLGRVVDCPLSHIQYLTNDLEHHLFLDCKVQMHEFQRT